MLQAWSGYDPSEAEAHRLDADLDATAMVAAVPDAWKGHRVRVLDLSP